MGSLSVKHANKHRTVNFLSLCGMKTAQHRFYVTQPWKMIGHLNYPSVCIYQNRWCCYKNEKRQKLVLEHFCHKMKRAERKFYQWMQTWGKHAKGLRAVKQLMAHRRNLISSLLVSLSVMIFDVVTLTSTPSTMNLRVFFRVFFCLLLS